MGRELYAINDDIDKSKYDDQIIYAVNHNVISEEGKDLRTMVIVFKYNYKSDIIEHSIRTFDIHLISYKPINISYLVNHTISYDKESININYNFLYSIGLSNDLLCDLVFDDVIDDMTFKEFIDRANRACSILNNINHDIGYYVSYYNKYMGIYAKKYIDYIKSEVSDDIDYIIDSNRKTSVKKMFKSNKYNSIRRKYRFLYNGNVCIDDFLNIYYGYDSNHIRNTKPSSTSYDFIYIDIPLYAENVPRYDVISWFNKNKNNVLSYGIDMLKTFYMPRFNIKTHQASILLLNGLISIILSRTFYYNNAKDYIDKDDDDFMCNYIDFKNGKITGKEAAKRCHVVYRKFIKYAKMYDNILLRMDELYAK